MFPFLQKANDFSKAKISSQKVKNSMVFSDFLNRYSLFLFIHDVFYAHILLSIFFRVAQKTMLCQQKITLKEVMLRSKIMWVTLKYFIATKKFDTRKRDSCWLNMFSVEQKRSTCWKKQLIKKVFCRTKIFSCHT